MKFSQPLGVVATIILMVSGFFHWAWYPDLQKYFTGFFSENNIYGKPGKVFIFLGILAVIFFLIPRIWAKRWNIFICAVVLAYAIKTFILFSNCYLGNCPVKQPALWTMLGASLLMTLFSLFPDTSLKTPDGHLPE